MAEDLRISASTSALDDLKQAFGLGSGRREVPMAGAASTTSATRTFVGGTPGNRILPADFPMDQLDHTARRGTYVDLLV